MDASPASAAPCPDEAVFAEFADGRLASDARAAIAAHVEDCPRCSDTLGLMVGAFAGDLAATASRETEPGNDPAGRPLSGRFADRYEIVSCVGMGAGGTVYSALDPELERVVALKVLRGADAEPGSSSRPDSKWTREAKAMAKVVHPNVVAVHDVGVAAGQVFIATEFVEGGSLNDWLHERARSWKEVVAVFVAAGRGLAAIHERGLVHRDFKPHNVLVGTDGRPRVTDFGLARLLPSADDEDLPTLHSALASLEIGETAATQTKTGMLVGTPAYMSPEQWRGAPAAARSDQFSFCVALYEALAGRRPFAGPSSVELYEQVCAGDVRPFASASATPGWLQRIVLKGLAVDPDRRFASMDALLAALEAGPALLRSRRRTAGLAVGFVGVAGMGYAVASLGGEGPCERQSARFASSWDADARRVVATDPVGASSGDRVVDSLDAWVAAWHEHSEAACRAAAVDGSISERQYGLQVACLDRRVAEFEAAVGVLETARAHRRIDILAALEHPSRCADPGKLAKIEPQWRDASGRALAMALAGELARAESLRVSGDYAAAKALATALSERVGEQGDPAVRAEVLLQLGLVQSNLRLGNEAVESLRAAVWAAEASGHIEVAASAWIEIAEVLGDLNDDFERAEQALERADAAAHRLGDPLQLAHVAGTRALLLSVQGQYDEALVAQTNNLAQTKALYGDRSVEVARVHMNVMAVLSHLGRHQQAQEHAAAALSIGEAHFAPTHPELAEFLNGLGATQIYLGQLAPARKTYARALAITEASLEPDATFTAILLSNSAHIDVADKRYDAAAKTYERILGIYRERYGDDHPKVALAHHNLAGVLDDAKDHEPAVVHYREALRIYLATNGPDHPSTANTQHSLGTSLFVYGEHEEGIALLEAALATRDRANVDPARRARSRALLGQAYDEIGRTAEGLSLAEEAVALLRDVSPRESAFRESVERWIADRR